MPTNIPIVATYIHHFVTTYAKFYHNINVPTSKELISKAPKQWLDIVKQMETSYPTIKDFLRAVCEA